MKEEIIYNVHWEGPFGWGDKNLNDPNFVLYSLHGTHPLYGNNVLLYIGLTETSPGKRFVGHANWVKDEYDDMTVKVATIDKFEDWDKWNKYEQNRYKKFKDSCVLKLIEGLLIIAHQPAYNIKNKETAIGSDRIRIFNTGAFGLLCPEVSSQYHVGEK